MLGVGDECRLVYVTVEASKFMVNLSTRSAPQDGMHNQKAVCTGYHERVGPSSKISNFGFCDARSGCKRILAYAWCDALISS